MKRERWTWANGQGGIEETGAHVNVVSLDQRDLVGSGLVSRRKTVRVWFACHCCWCHVQESHPFVMWPRYCERRPRSLCAHKEALFGMSRCANHLSRARRGGRTGVSPALLWSFLYRRLGNGFVEFLGRCLVDAASPVFCFPCQRVARESDPAPMA